MAHHPFQLGNVVQKLQKILYVVVKLRQEFLGGIVLQVQRYTNHKPDFHHSKHILLLLQLLELIAKPGNGFLPLDECFILQLDVKAAEPFTNGVSFALVTAFWGLQEVFYLTGVNGLRIVILLLKSHVAAQREHGTHCRFDLMDRTPVILQ